MNEPFTHCTPEICSNQIKNEQPAEKTGSATVLTVFVVLFAIIFTAANFVALYYLFPVYILMSLIAFVVYSIRLFKHIARRFNTPTKVLRRLRRGEISAKQAIQEIKRCRRT